MVVTRHGVSVVLLLLDREKAVSVALIQIVAITTSKGVSNY